MVWLMDETSSMDKRVLGLQSISGADGLQGCADGLQVQECRWRQIQRITSSQCKSARHDGLQVVQG